MGIAGLFYMTAMDLKSSGRLIDTRPGSGHLRSPSDEPPRQKQLDSSTREYATSKRSSSICHACLSLRYVENVFYFH